MVRRDRLKERAVGDLGGASSHKLPEDVRRVTRTRCGAERTWRSFKRGVWEM